MVDIYKKILVNQYDENATENGEEKNRQQHILKRVMAQTGNHICYNDQNVAYGDGKVRIEDFGLFDDSDRPSNMLMKRIHLRLSLR